MITTLVDVYVKEENIEDFKVASKANHLGSIAEPDNLRFDILQNPDDPSHFVLYEAYATQEGVLAHKETAHYLTWRDKVAPWMAKPRQGTKFEMVFPESKEQA